MIPRKSDAIRALVGGAITAASDGSNVVYYDGQTPPTEEAINAKFAELLADYESKAYQRNREYPSIGDQLDLIYWDKINGTENWKEAIDKVKQAHPKPE